MNRIKEYIQSDSNEPFVLNGDSGCGKTSILAKAYSQLPLWLNAQNPQMILRFLGTSPDSSSILPLLKSLSNQICIIRDLPRNDMPDEMSPLSHYFKKLLSNATHDTPLIIFLDSLDLLSAQDGAHELPWLPTVLPPNCKIVISTLMGNILKNLENMMQTEKNYCKIEPCGEELAMDILKLWLNQRQRTVSEQQWKIVNEAISKCNLPLFVRLVYDEVCRWKSYTQVSLTL